MCASLESFKDSLLTLSNTTGFTGSGGIDQLRIA